MECGISDCGLGGIEHMEIQWAAGNSSLRASRHVPSASLGHYASLSFIVIGRKQNRFIRELLSIVISLPFTIYDFSHFYDLTN